MAKVVTAKEAVAGIKDGASIMFGGFMGCGNAHVSVKALAESGVKNLTMICNDASMPNGPDGEDYYGVAKLIHNRQVKKLIATHVGLNPEVAQQMNEGTLEVVLVPQGSLVEMIRAGGYGLGGVLTSTGIGTIVEDAEHVHGKIEIDGKQYLIEKPVRADFAFINGYKVDKSGNMWYKGTTRNFNQVMAMAADTVIAEADILVEVGEIEPENVMTPGILVNYIVEGRVL
ncbi:MAG: CoA transferase subunit A [Defluviitaleaceae bacterium]|nr:CoA transferase subunit A [Defluviitaleaceae bacterium]